MGDMDEVLKDPRFSHIVKDARFRRLPKKHVKVKVDKRFQSMFTDKKFQIKCRVDKRGRPVDIGGSEDLRRYYEMSDSEEQSGDEEEDEEQNDAEEGGEQEDEAEESSVEDDEEDIPDEKPKQPPAKKQKEKKKKKDSTDECQPEKSDDIQEKTENKANSSRKDRAERKLLSAEIKRKLRDKKIDYARGEGKFISDSSSEEEVSEVEESDVEEHDWGELDNDAETTEEATNRLAICNMDWDRIKAVDLMVLFHSFLPAGGLIHSITIYPSEFGAQRMKEEEENGPIELKELTTEKEDEELDQEQMEKLRKYQLNRLKYYYGIMVCDTKETANTLYKECDGLEYETSAVKLDLRFVPDDTTFDQEPKDVCTALPDLSTYKPRLFQTTALTRSKVELTWDENDPDREDLVRSVRSGNIDENQLKQYLAYSSEEDDDYEDAKILVNEEAETKPETEQSSIDKYKSLLASIESSEMKKKNNEVNLEVTWNLKLENKASEIVKKKMKEKEEMTPFEQYMDKRKEKKKLKKQERLAQIEKMEKGSGGETENEAFSDDEVPSDVDLNDPYFKEELDQMKPKTKKKKKQRKEVDDVEGTEKDRQNKAELELLMLDGDDAEDKHFNMKKIEERESGKKKKKKLKGKKRKADGEKLSDAADDFKIDVHDERFSALYLSHHFNIDPTDPQYRPTKATKELIEEKLRRRAADEPVEKSRKIAQENGKQRKAEMSVLVKNIKKNTVEMKRI